MPTGEPISPAAASGNSAVTRLIESLFSRIDTERAFASAKPTITAQFYQLYGELVCDLIEPTKDSLLVQENEIKQTYIPELTKVTLENSAVGLDLFSKITTNKHTMNKIAIPASTEFFVFEMEMDGDKPMDGISYGKVVPRLTVVKACGAELLFEDPNKLVLQEGPYVAKSKGEHSILSKILSEEFGGNSITNFLVTFNPADTPQQSTAILSLSQRMRKLTTYPMKATQTLRELLNRRRTLISRDNQDSLLSSSDKPGSSKQQQVLAKTNSKLKEDLEILQVRLFDVTTKCNALQTSNDCLDVTCKDLERDKLILKRELLDTQLEANKLSEELEATRAELQNRSSSLNSSASELQEKLKVAKQELDKVQHKCDDLQKELKRVTLDRDDGLQRIQGLAKSNKMLEAKNAEVSLELVKVLNYKGVSTKESDMSKAELAKLRQHNEFLRRRLEQTQRNTVDAGSEIEKMLRNEETKRRELSESVIMLEQSIKVLQNEKEQLEKERDKAKAQYDELKASVDSLLHEQSVKNEKETELLCEKHRIALDDLTRKNDRLAEKLQDMTSKNDRSSMELKISLETINEKENAIADLQSKIRTLREEQTCMLEQFRSKLESIGEDISNIKKPGTDNPNASTKILIERLFKEALHTYQTHEKKLKEELRAQRELNLSLQATIENTPSSKVEKFDINALKSEIRKFTMKVQFELEAERTNLLTRATIAEELLKNK
ncbi:hypothetical protein HDV05_003059 [Chytridiales sp. JEL 0842]|nr:hypothetical protein HDV05_003059 [Chytridiales sp. JEL 0842]